MSIAAPSSATWRGPRYSRLVAGLLLAATTVGAPRHAYAASLIQNGDFSLGNTGFSSDYTAGTSTVVAGTFCIDTNPLNCHVGVASYGDHTTGTGLMLNANGSLTVGQAVWRQTISVTQGTRYVFDGWVASWARAIGDDPSPARLRLLIDGAQVGQDFAAPAPVGQWVEFAVAWDSGASGSVSIEIVDTNLGDSGNDFSLDDLSLNEIPSFTEFPIPTADSMPIGITSGPDGNLWFAEFNRNQIGRITPGSPSVVTEFRIPTADTQPPLITAAPDGNLWFTESNNNRIGQLNPALADTTCQTTPTHCITESAAFSGTGAGAITVGSDANLWFAQADDSTIGRITPGTNAITQFMVQTAQSRPGGIAAGPDGNLWFTGSDPNLDVPIGSNTILRITPGGSNTITPFTIPTANSRPVGITAGPDGNLWFTEFDGNKIGRIAPTSPNAIAEFPIPRANSQPLLITAGPDGNLWFAESNGNSIGRINPSLADTTCQTTPAVCITEFPIPTANSRPSGITVGPDGSLWFTELSGNQIGRLNPIGPDGILARGICRRPGLTGLIACAPGALVTASLCGNASCSPASRVVLVSSVINATGGFALLLNRAQVAGKRLIFRATILAGANDLALAASAVSAADATDVTFEIIDFGPVAANGQFGTIVIDPVSEAATQILQNRGLENFENDGIRQVISQIRMANDSTDFGGVGADAAVVVAVQTAQNDPAVQQAIQSAFVCRADCDRSGMVSAPDLLNVLALALGVAGSPECEIADTSGDGHITVDEILLGVNRAVTGCAAPGSELSSDAARTDQILISTPLR